MNTSMNDPSFSPLSPAPEVAPSGKMLKCHRGFTLVEVCVVIAIIGLMCAIGFSPGHTEDRQLKAAARDLYTDFGIARMEAMKRHKSVGISITPASGSNNGNYVLFLDDGQGGGTANDGIANGTEATDTDNIVKTIPMPSTVELLNSSTLTSFSFNAKGQLNSVTTGYIQMQNSRTDYQVVMYASGTGRIQSSIDNGGTWYEN